MAIGQTITVNAILEREVAPNVLEARVDKVLALRQAEKITSAQFLVLKRLIEDRREPKDLTDYLDDKLSERDFLELLYAGVFEPQGVPRGKP